MISADNAGGVCSKTLSVNLTTSSNGGTSKSLISAWLISTSTGKPLDKFLPATLISLAFAPKSDFNVEFKYYGMFSFIASIITSPFTSNGNNFFVKFLYNIEKKHIKNNYFKYFAVYSIFKIKKF